MPTFMQGDIFTEALDNRYDMAIVFGYLGLNEMALTWHEARRLVPEWRDVDDPFEGNEPTQIEGHTPWWWFVSLEENHGMTDECFGQTIGDLFDWARQNNASSIITNGISDVDRGTSTDANRASDDRRVALINNILTAYESQGFHVTLISLNDAYTRNLPQ